MRAALRSLTFRGRALIAVGLGLGIGASLSGQRDVLRIAVLLVVLPLIAAAFVLRTHFRLGATRVIAPAQVPVGTTAQVELSITNLSSVRTGTLLLDDAVPAVLGYDAHRVIERVESGGIRTTTYGIQAQRRGRFEVGPLSVTAVDPFGLIRLRRSFTSTEAVLVVPRVEALDGIDEVALHATGDAATASLASRGDDDIIPRDYRLGDDLRRIHWRATARTGDLMVRREERPWTRQASIVVDATTAHHVGSGPQSSLEIALSCAASAAVHLLREGWRVRLSTTDGRVLTEQASGAAGIARIMEALAVLEPADDPEVTHGVRPAHDLTIAIITSDPASLRQVVPTRQRGIALVVDNAAWSADSAVAAQRAVDRLRAEGWQSAEVSGQPGSIGAAWVRAAGGHLADSGARR